MLLPKVDERTFFFGPKAQPFHLVLDDSGLRFVPGYAPADLPLRDDPKKGVLPISLWGLA